MLQSEKYSTKLRKDDLVEIIAGKDKGKQGKIKDFKIEKGRVVVEGLNMVKKALKKKSQQDRGGIIDVEAAIDLSNVMIVCKKCGPTRVGIQIDEAALASAKTIKDKTAAKKRVCRKCGGAL